MVFLRRSNGAHLWQLARRPGEKQDVIKMKRFFFINLSALIVFFCCVSSALAVEVRIKDIAYIQGVAKNQLIGFGIVVGLSGTGDSNRTIIARQSLVNMMSKMGMQISVRDIQAKNAAAVVVTAELPAFAKEGDRIDVTVSSLGDARSIAGGMLLLTGLRAADGKVYASAQGTISTTTGQRAARGARRQVVPMGRMPNGGLISKSLDEKISDMNAFSLRLKNPDFTTAALVAKEINDTLGDNTAKAVDDSTVLITVPMGFKGNLINFISTIKDIKIAPDIVARIVINERTGTIVIGENVRISTVAVSHGNLSVQVVEPVAPNTTIYEVVKALNTIGATTQDIIAIFQAMKVAGALQAEIIIM